MPVCRSRRSWCGPCATPTWRRSKATTCESSWLCWAISSQAADVDEKNAGGSSGLPACGGFILIYRWSIVDEMWWCFFFRWDDLWGWSLYFLEDFISKNDGTWEWRRKFAGGDGCTTKNYGTCEYKREQLWFQVDHSWLLMDIYSIKWFYYSPQLDRTVI